MITGLLRERYGFDGIVCTDWGLITDARDHRQRSPARAWGVEHLTERERMIKVLEAGVDQFGGEAVPRAAGRPRRAPARSPRTGSTSRSGACCARSSSSACSTIRSSTRTLPAAIVGNAEFRAAGEAAQRASITLLTNGSEGSPVLPLARGISLYVEGIDAAVAAPYGTVVESPADADVAILRLKAPYEQRATTFENFFHAGSLDFPDEVIAHVREVARPCRRSSTSSADRPAILTPFVGWRPRDRRQLRRERARRCSTCSPARPSRRASCRSTCRASMAAVEASRPDVPFDTADPLFRFGHGLRYPG